MRARGAMTRRLTPDALLAGLRGLELANVISKTPEAIREDVEIMVAFGRTAVMSGRSEPVGSPPLTHVVLTRALSRHTLRADAVGLI